MSGYCKDDTHQTYTGASPTQLDILTLEKQSQKVKAGRQGTDSLSFGAQGSHRQPNPKLYATVSTKSQKQVSAVLCDTSSFYKQ